MRERQTMTPPRARDRRAPTAPTPIPDNEGGLVDRVWAAASELPATARKTASGAAQRAADKAVDWMSGSAGFMGSVGILCVSIALLYLFAHGFLGWFPERVLVEARADVRRLEAQLAETEAELNRVRQLLFKQSRQDGSGEAQ